MKPTNPGSITPVNFLGNLRLSLWLLIASFAAGIDDASAIALNFTDPANTGSGVGKSALYSNVGTQDGGGIDVLATIIDQGPVSQNNGLKAENGDLRTSLAAGVTNATTWMTVTYEFFETGTNTPITVRDLGLTIDDLDGYSNRIESIETSGVKAYTLNSPTGVMGSVAGDVYTFTGAANHNTGESEGAVNIQFLDSSSIWIKYQSELNVTGGAAAFYHDGAGSFSFDNPEVTELLPRLYYTYNFNNDSEGPVAVDFFDSLPEEIIWDTGYTPVTTTGLVADVVYSNSNRDASIPGMMMPAGASTLTLCTITTSRIGTIDNDAMITPAGSNQEPMIADASIDLDPLGSSGPSGGSGGSDKSESLWALAEDGNGRLVEFRNYKTASVAVTDWGEIYYSNNGTLTLFSSPSELESLTITGAGIAYFVRNSATSIDGSTYVRPMFSLDIQALQPGDTPVATLVGDLSSSLASLTGDSNKWVTGLAIQPGTNKIYMCYDGTGNSGFLFTINSFSTDANGQLNDLTLVGLMAGVGEVSAGVEDIAFAPDGTLYMVDRTSDKIYTIDPDSAAITGVLSNETLDSKIEGIAVHPSDSDIVISETNGNYEDWMLSVNPGTDNNTAYFDYNTRFSLSDIEGMAFYTYEVSSDWITPSNPFTFGMYATDQIALASINVLNISGGMRSETAQIKISDSVVDITGGMEAATSIQFKSGATGTVSGDLTAVGSVSVGPPVIHSGAVTIGPIGTKQLFQLPAPTGTSDPNYAHPITIISGDYTIDGPLALEGTIYVTGQIHFEDGQSITGSGALVAGDQIHISAVNTDIGGTADGIFLYSLSSQIHVSNCTGLTVNGVIYAPNGQVHFGNVGSATISGGIYSGDQIHLSGLSSLGTAPGVGYKDVIPPGIVSFIIGD